jgi:DNA adenine methylase
MAELLPNLDGAFILSINDTPEIRETFAGFEIEEAALRYSIRVAGATAARELLISNRAQVVRLI